MVSSVSSSTYASQVFVRQVSLPTLTQTQKNAMESLTAQLGKTQFKEYSQKNYFDDRHIYMQSWSDEAYKNSTDQNIGKLKQALMGYATSYQSSINTYSFTVSDEGIVKNLSSASDGYFHDINGNPISQEAIAQAIQSADQDQDGIISSLEMQNKIQALQKSGNMADATLLSDIKNKIDITSPDQFIQLNEKNGRLEIKVYNTDKLANQSNTLSVTTSGLQASSVTTYSASVEETSSIDALKDREKVLNLLKKSDVNHDGSVTIDELKNYRSSLQDTEQNTNDIKLLDNLLTEDRDGISNYLRLASSYGVGTSITLSRIEQASKSWSRFIQIYKTGLTADPLRELGVVSKS